jgi:hypothetical protein
MWAEVRHNLDNLHGEIRAIEGLAVLPAQRLAVALAAEHGARTSTIRYLKLVDVDLPNRRITL